MIATKMFFLMALQATAMVGGSDRIYTWQNIGAFNSIGACVQASKTLLNNSHMNSDDYGAFGLKKFVCIAQGTGQ